MNPDRCGAAPCAPAASANGDHGDPSTQFALVPKLDYATGLLGDIPVPFLFPVGAGVDASDDVPLACKALPKSITQGATALACRPGQGGVWLVHVRATRSEEGERGVWKVGFARGGRAAWGQDHAYERLSNGYSVAAPPQAASVGDLDGDGAEDAVLWSYDGVNSSDVGERTLTVYTLQKGQPKPIRFFERYASFALRDCNGDAKPEVYYDPYRNYGSERSLSFVLYNRRSSPAWSLIAELTPKGPIQDGPVSRAYAARLCADVPETALPQQRPGAWPHVIHCRRLRGASGATIEAELTRACSNATGDRATFCRLNHEVLRKMARDEPPFSLSPSDALAPAECLLPPVAPD